MAFPRAVLVELLLNGVWTDVTQWVLQAPPLVITRGRPDGAGKAVPSVMSLSLDDRDGRFGPRNPHGPYSGQLGRNTPIRMSLGIVSDTFGRTVSNGWGSADTGEAWTVFGAGGSVLTSDFNVAGGVGTLSVPATSAYRAAFTPVGRANVDVAATFSLPFTNVTGGNVEPAGILLRGQSITNYYMVRAVVTSAEAVAIEVHHSTGGLLAGPVTVAGLVHSAGQALRMRAVIEGQTIRGKVWAAASGEPEAWQVTATSSTITAAGFVGVRAGVASGNTNTKPIVVSVDKFEVRRSRFHGEIASLSPAWDPTHKYRVQAITAAGVLRRLGQGASPLRSALRRWTLANATNLVAYWPLSEGSLGTFARPEVGTTPMTLTNRLATSAYWGQGDLGPVLEAGVALHGGDRLTAAVSMPTFVDRWAVTFVRASALESFTSVYIETATGRWRLLFASDQTITVMKPDGSPLSYVIFDGDPVADQGPHFFRLTAQQSGGSTSFGMSFDTASGLISGSTVHTLSAIQSITVVDDAPHTGHNVLSQVGVYTIWPLLSTHVDAVRGHPGEAAGRRLQRLCAENDITFGAEGDLDDTAAMGPQRVGTLVDQFDECAITDGGPLFEGRLYHGVGYRTRVAMYNRAVTATLDYSARQVAQPFRPVDDDQLVRNQVTAQRVAGGEFTLTQETGPLSVSKVGRYDAVVDVNVASEAQLPDVAGWLRRIGTVDESRYPAVRVDLRTVSAELGDAVLDLEIGGRLDLVNLQAIDVYDGASLLVSSYTEVVNTAYSHSITFNGLPASPWRVWALEDAELGRLHTAGSELASSATSTATNLSVATTVGPIWGTQVPYDLLIGCERVRVTAVTGSSSPQTMTVTRSVNGVVKAHGAGEPVTSFSQHAIRR